MENRRRSSMMDNLRLVVMENCKEYMEIATSQLSEEELKGGAI